MILPASAIEVIETWRLGFVATCANGRPNVSPKGTFVVLDNQTIAFGALRSPQTMENLRDNPDLEVNFVNILTRKGVRIRGRAEVIDKGTDTFSELFPRFEVLWGDLCALMTAIVRIPVVECRPLTSPIYDLDGDEVELKAVWKAKIAEM